MKILFATPNLSLEERYGTLAGGGSAAPSLGILSLAAVCRKHGYRTAVIDSAALGLDEAELLRRLQKERPEVLGLSATTLSILHAQAVASKARRVLPGLRVLIGGPHVSAVPVESLERFSAFDIAVVGEGEETIIELLRAIEGGAGLEDVRGIAWRCDGAVRLNPSRLAIKHLDNLPFPAWDLLEGFPARYVPAPFKTRRLPSVSLVSSRGCPHRCIFCDRSVFGSACHAFSAEYLLELVKDLHKSYGVREVCFEDDTFMTSQKRLVEICRGLTESRLDLSWSCLARVNDVTAENLALMRRAGCWQVSFGIESGSQGILDRIHKKVTLEQIRRALLLSRAAGLMNKGFFIVGHPGETPQTLGETLRFMLDLPLDDVSVSMLTPFPGSELYERAEEFGSFERDWSRMNLLNPVFIPFGLTREDLLAAQKEMIRSFYLRPRIVLNYMRRVVRNPALARGMWCGFKAFARTVKR